MLNETSSTRENGDETANMTSRITCPLDTGVVSLPAMQRTRADAGIDPTHSLSPRNERSLYIDIRATSIARGSESTNSPLIKHSFYGELHFQTEFFFMCFFENCLLGSVLIVD
ncbi:hypothetical protein CDAR_97841 [Caerostris darwini]|uniref:Uncharacterized protein n=1 Tax=Caerostris darwini TaxID=1538125 RepID=A0AAV4MDG5_9ARAC|nr:hypothetical protein CDAR_97841 [Caerostris darwini]